MHSTEKKQDAQQLQYKLQLYYLYNYKSRQVHMVLL